MESVLRAFNTKEAHRLTGLTLRRLQYWDETDFIRPSVAARKGRGSPRLYSFRDIVQLRVAALLRDRLSLQALRRLKQALDVDAPFATVRFAILPEGELVYLGPTGQLESPRAPGQIVMTFDVQLDAIRAGLEEGIRRLHTRSVRGQIAGTKGVLAGERALVGTRITPGAIQRMLRAGWSAERIIGEYPELTTEDIEAAATPAAVAV